MKFKALRGAFSKEEGDYITQRVRNGIIERPYKIGNKVEWMSDERAYRVKDLVNDINRQEKRIHTKLNKDVLKEQREKGIKKATVKEQEKKLKKEIEKLKKKVNSDDYNRLTRNYLARMDKIVEGMQRSMGGDQAFKTVMEEFYKEFQTLTLEQRQRFYEQNHELFTDMSDYYNYIRKQAEVVGEKGIPEGFSSYDEYRNIRIREIETITGKIRVMKKSGIL